MEKQGNKTRGNIIKQIPFEQIPLGVLFVIWPMLVHMDVVNSWLKTEPWFPDIDYQADFFMHFRSVTLLILAVWMLYLSRSLFLEKRWKKFVTVFWPVLAYGILVILSTCFSEHPGFSLFGMQEQYESVFVLLAYVVVTVYGYYIVKRRTDRKRIAGMILTGAAVQAAIGLSQMAGCDFWSTAAGRWLILLGQDSGSELGFVFAEDKVNSVYLSFYNPNYAAVYLLLVIPICGFAVIGAKKLWKKISLMILLAALLICLWGTGSKAGLITLVSLCILGGILFLDSAKKKLCFALILCMVLAGGVLAESISGETSVVQRIYKSFFPKEKTYKLEQVLPQEDGVLITYAGTDYYLQLEQEEDATYFSVIDKDGKSLPMNYDAESERFSLLDIDKEDVAFEAYTSQGDYWIIFHQGEIPWYFKKEKNGEAYQYLTLYGKVDVPKNAEYAFGKGYETALSDRIYLWSRTVPLLKDYLILGSGPDSFAIKFPQNDYVMRANLGLDMLMSIISRAHSFYLQNWLQTGLLSLVMILIFGVRCLIWMLQGRRHGTAGNEGLFLAILGFFIMGITNDSVVVVSPIFWTLLGMGYAVTEK